MVSTLPVQSYAVRPGTEDVILIKRGESGFNATDLEGNGTFVQELNRKMGVSGAQAQAMLVGSIFGWDIPGADPDKYKEEDFDA